MPRNVALRASAVVACSMAILSGAAAVRAQGVDTFNPGADQVVSAIAFQPDGKIIVAGSFTHLGGGTGTTLRNHIGRLNADGTVDPSFDPGTNSIVQAVAVQPNGQILIGGNFTSVGGGNGLLAVRNHIARLNADGSVDAVFNPGANGNVYAFALQPDGKVVVGGEFSTMGGGNPGTTRNRLARLNPDGSPDSFDPGVSKPGASAIVYTLALQADGKIVVGGYFNGLGGGTGTTLRNYIGRINADGTLDTGFDPGANSISGVNALAIQADGKILVGGSFTGLGLGTGVTLRGNIGRLNVDGTVDSFNPGAEAQVLTLGVQTDGRILAGGYFKWLGAAGNPSTRSVRNYIGRINPDGLVDNTFDPGAGNVVNAVAIQPDGPIVAGGVFLTLGGGTGLTTPRNRIGRMTNTDATTQTLTLTGGGTIETWSRSGGGPEVSRVTFEFSFDGSFYSFLGNGTRTAGGWQFTTGPNLPTSGTVYLRARGFYGTGFQNGSGSIVEFVRNVNGNAAPTITSVPNRSTPVGTAIVVGFSVGDADSGPAAVIVGAYSSNTTLVPNANLAVSGVGANRTVTITPAPNLSSVTTITLTASDGSLTTSTSFVVLVGSPVRGGDFDGDARSEVAVFRPSTGTWFIRNSATGTFLAASFGVSTDLPVVGDYDGDGVADIAIFRGATGTWWIRQSSQGITAVPWGIAGDVPVQADYDGDGRTDVAVFRAGTWYVRHSSDGSFEASSWGIVSDVPVPGDYDADGKADIAVFRPSAGTWYLRESTAGYVSAVWGGVGDVPVAGDYDGDGRTDIAVFRPSTGVWYIRNSSTGLDEGLLWGGVGDVPVPGDYDGDGKTDMAVFRPSNGTFYLRSSSTGALTAIAWGVAGDIPILRRP